MKKKPETWAMIKGYELRYWVSSWGRIQNKWGCFLKSQENQGYNYIGLCLLGKKKDFHISRLVAFHFVDNPNNKPYVNHIDGIKRNDYYENLEWATQKENVEHAIRTGLTPVGEDRSSAKLNNSQVLEILNSNKKTEELSSVYDVCVSLISAIRRGVRWNHLTKKKYTPRFISNKDVLSIFESPESTRELSKKYNTQDQVIRAIKTGEAWSCITGKTHKRKRLKRKYKGKLMTLKEICEIEGVGRKSIDKRMSKGDTLAEAIKKQKQYLKTRKNIRYKNKQKELSVTFKSKIE